MRIEFRVEGRLVAVEAEGAVTVRISEEEGTGRLGEDMASRIAELRRGFAEAPEEAPEPAPGAEDGVVAEGEASVERGGVPAIPDEIRKEAGAAAEMDLFMRLSSLRRELAAEAGVPPYVVFQDKSLHEMAEKRPQDMDALSAISGVGKARLEKYGERFLSVIAGDAA